MRSAYAVATTVIFVVGVGVASTHSALPVAGPNANRVAAGNLRNGILTVMLDAQQTNWYPDGDSLPPVTLEAFAEKGKAPLVPGPLIRVPRGTEIRASIHNSLMRDTLTVHIPATAHGGTYADPGDSVVIPPGETRELKSKVTVPGNYTYNGTTGPPFSIDARMRGLLVGALVVDTANAVEPHRDRIFVITLAPDSVNAAPATNPGRPIFAINGRSWPRTERLTATVGDTAHWRFINASNDVHPLHLHGFYYRVDALTGPLIDPQQAAPGRMVVTERLSEFSAMSMTWIPERPGNWLFHCHFQLHLVADGSALGVQLAGGPAGVDHAMHDTTNHALNGMAGLVMGITVAPKKGVAVAADPGPGRRRLRLVAIKDAGFPDSAPSMRFVLEEPGSATPRLEARPGFSPTITLTRGEPVSIMVVNHLTERTAVHWHGIELESYYDGVAGFSGSAARISPAIAPGDSFEARFTPPRSGTFMYHSHVSEVRQHQAGLLGPIVVRDSRTEPVGDDKVFFLKGARLGVNATDPLEINGTLNPDTVVLHAGKTARLRFIGLPSVNPNATVWVTTRPDSSFRNLRDTMVVRWRPIAKDGADLPPAARVERLARQIVSMGETYDFELTPQRRGQVLRIEVRGAAPQGRLLVRVPIRVD